MRYYGIIYKTTNLLNNKFYIGQTTKIEKYFQGEYFGSGTLFIKAFKKYRKQNFKTEFICYALCQKELDNLEREYILKYNSVYPNGYNLDNGGNGIGRCGETTKEKISIANKGRIHSLEARKKIST